MTKAQAARLKPGDKVKFHRGAFEYTVKKVVPYVNGLVTSKELKERGWDGYFIHLEECESGVEHKRLLKV